MEAEEEDDDDEEEDEVAAVEEAVVSELALPPAADVPWPVLVTLNSITSRE